MRSRLVAVSLCFALTSSLGPLAYADEPPQEAKRAFAEGKDAYDHGDYSTALRDFQRAQLIAPAPSLHYNIGMAYERLGRFAEAAGSFDKYLAQVGPARSDDERAAQARVRERAGADRARSEGAQPGSSDPPPTPLVEPPQQPPPGYAPYYYYAPYGQPMMAPPLALVPREERIRRAKSQRTTGIVLVAIGGGLIILGAALIGVAATHDYDNHVGLDLGCGFGGAFALVGGIATAIPGAVYLAKGQSALNREKHTPPDDSAATRRAALDLAAPTVAMARPTLSMALPPIRF